MWSLWCHCGSQWRASSLGALGLDYPACRLVADTLGLDWTPGLLLGLQRLEDDLLAELDHERRSSDPH